MRTGDDGHVTIRLHRLQVDQRDRVGLLIDGDDGAGQVRARRLGNRAGG